MRFNVFNKLHIVHLALAVLVTVAVIGGTLDVAHALSTDAAKSSVCDGINAVSSCGSDGGTTLNKILKAVLTVLSIVAGLLAVIMIIVSGFKYITSSGDATTVGSAKKTLIYAIVGLIIVASAQIIVRFVLKNV